jgi:hypothetical protein
MSTRQATVLVGFAEALAAPEVVWSLAEAGFSVVAFARKGRASSLRHSRHVVCHEICPPEVDLQASLGELQSLLVSLSAEVGPDRLIVFPLDDKAVWLGSRLRPGNRWLLAGPQGANAELTLNKCLQMQAARDAGFNVPKTGLAKTANDVFSLCASESFPIILKPSECVPLRQGRLYECRKWTCANQSELERAVAAWQESVPLLVQPFIAGTGEGVFGLAAPDGIRAWSGHRRLRMMNPQGSGSSACIAQQVSEDLKSKTEEFVRRTGWHGLFMVELLRDPAGKTWFVELNGRPWGSMALSRRLGLEYPAWHVNLAIDEQSQAGRSAPDLREVVCRHAGREFMHLLFVLRGPKSRALNNWPPFWKTLADVGRVHHGDTLYNWRRDDPKVFISDFVYTIKDNVFKSNN